MGKRIGLAVMLAGLLSTSVLATVAPVAAQYTFWLGRDWAHRREVDIANPCGGEVTDYQVQISLDSTNFDFDLAESDGVDLRVTSSNGGTLIPFWNESWDAVGETASVWVKVPVIPVEGTSVFLY